MNRLEIRLRMLYYDIFGWPDIPLTQAAHDLLELTNPKDK